MPWQMINLQFLLPPFLFVLFRVSGLALSAPLIGSRAAPPQLKAAFSFVLSLMLFPMVLPQTPQSLTLPFMVVNVLGELLVGLLIGMSVDLVFLGARLTGTIIGQQAGIALGRVINPMLEGNSTIVGQLYYLVTLMIFLSVGGHRALIRALLDSFQAIPPGSFQMDRSMLELLEQMLTGAFVVGLRLAAPALTALFIASLTMGFIARTIPQLNILTIGFPVRIFVALIMSAVSLTLVFDLLYDAMIRTFELVRGTFGLVG